MSAIRLARAYTKRKYIVKFEGCYHGHADALLVKAGSGVATLGIPGSAGVPEEFTQFTLALPFNDVDALEQAFKKFRDQIACVIVEPAVGNMGCVPPASGYLQALRAITQREKTVLILDEVMTGFRLAFGGAQELYGITPDLTTLGKIIGGGLPVGAYGGPAEIMDLVAPLGPVYQAGTLSGNPLAMAAGIATLQHLREHKEEIYPRLEKLGNELAAGVAAAANEAGVPICYNRVGSMFTWFFTAGPVTDWDSAAKSDTEAFGRFFRSMLDSGILPAAFAIRSCIPERRPQRGRHSADDCRSEAGVHAGDGVGSTENWERNARELLFIISGICHKLVAFRFVACNQTIGDDHRLRAIGSESRVAAIVQQDHIAAANLLEDLMFHVLGRLSFPIPAGNVPHDRLQG